MSLASLEKSLDDPQHANDIVRILSMLEESLDSANDYMAAAHACFRYFAKNLRDDGALTRAPPKKRQKRVIERANPDELSGDDAALAFSMWMRQQLLLFRDILLNSGISNADLEVRGTSFQMLMKLMKAESLTTVSTRGMHQMDNTLFVPIVEKLMEIDAPEELVDLVLDHYLCFPDIACFFFRNIKSHIEKKNKSELNVSSVFNWLMAAKTPNDAKWISGAAPKGKKRQRTDSGSNDWKKEYQSAWLALVGLLSLPEKRRLLIALPNDIIPKFMEPAALLDFVTDAYDEGGVMSVLSLEVLLILITEHKLDYPRFFPRLYALLTPTTAYAPHATRFLALCDRVLTSTHVPAYVTAAFVKRLSRFALFAPPTTLLHAIPVCYNAVKNHPVCTLLVHRDRNVSSDGAGDGVLAIDTSTTSAAGGTGPDCFDTVTDNPSECAAAASSLWELEAAKNHYFAPISRSVDPLEAPIKPTAQQMPMPPPWSRGYDTLFERSLTFKPRIKGKKESGPFPLAHLLPKALFEDVEWIE